MTPTQDEWNTFCKVQEWCIKEDIRERGADLVEERLTDEEVNEIYQLYDKLATPEHAKNDTIDHCIRRVKNV